MVTLAGRGYIRQKLSEANVGRASSGASATRGITHSAHVFRDPTGQAPNEGAPQGAVSVQLDDLARVKAMTNQNDSDGELDGSRSKVDYVVSLSVLRVLLWHLEG
ncbi:hypothetical protein FRC08_015147 [Ceratobasidium sp. 394]|nr:hypothetical protein FRC08_015147 [Ceratobasidium sp. 394]